MTHYHAKCGYKAGAEQDDGTAAILYLFVMLPNYNCPYCDPAVHIMLWQLHAYLQLEILFRER